MKRVICLECGQRKAMPALPSLNVTEMFFEDDDGEDTKADVVFLDSVNKREKEVKKHLRRIWIAETMEEREKLIQELLERLDE